MVERINQTQSGRGYLFRASASDICNYNCAFCRPNENEPVDILTNEQFLNIFRPTNDLLKIKTLHFTGGEPLMRGDLPGLISECRELAGDDFDIAMTSNGALLQRNLDDLVKAGLSRVNISVHSLDPLKYQLFTGTKNDINQVLDSIKEAKKIGLGVKTNTAVIRGFNDTEISDMAEFAFKIGIIPRFLELGLYGPVTQWFSSEDLVSHNEIKDTIEERFGSFERDLTYRGNGPTKYYTNSSGETFGILDNQSDILCRGCDRLRLSANGYIKVCNFPPIDLRPFIGFDNEMKEQLLKLSNVLSSRGEDYIGKRIHRNDYNFRWNHPEKNIE